MPVGETVKLHFDTLQDPTTGHVIQCLTPKEAVCHRNYFYQKCFTQTGNQLLFGANFDGPLNYYLLNFDQQTATQLTQGEGDNTFGGFLSYDDQYLYYMKNQQDLKRVALKTKKEELIYRTPEDWVAYGTWVANSICTKIVGIEIRKSDWRSLSDWQIFREFFFAQPLCRIISIDLQTGQRTILFEENRWLGHPMYRPYHDETITFCHEGPHDLVSTRMWFMNANGSHMRPVKQQLPTERCTHEFWVPDGSALVYVSYHENEVDRLICRIHPDTFADEKLMVIPSCSHLMSNEKGNLIVGDGIGKPIDVKIDQYIERVDEPFLYLFDVNEKSTQKIVAHNTSWDVFMGDRQMTHPHPSFTPDDKQVLYTSDCFGNPMLLLAMLS